MNKERVTLKDIGKILGISKTTVSKALKDYPDISKETKQAVLALAKEMEYEPNSIALKLRKNKSFIVGVIIPEIVHHFFSNVISGIVEVADQHGYSILLTQTNETYEREVREAKVLLSTRVDGLLISLSNDTVQYKHLETLQQYGVPVVLFDKICDGLQASKVVVDDFNGAFMAVEHLVQQGCKYIAHIRGPKDPENAKQRFAGYVAALEKYGLPFSDDYVKQCKQVTQEEGYEFTKQLVSLPQPPDGIFAVTDEVAVGCMMAIKEFKLAIPQDVALIGFSDWKMASVLEPKLSSVYQPAFEMGKRAFEILLKEMEIYTRNEVPDFQNVVLNTTLKVRESSLKRLERS